MSVRQVDRGDKRELKRFVGLEHELLGGEPRYVPELASDLAKRLRGRSPFYEEMEHGLFVASTGRDVARCVAFINRRWQRDKRDRAGFVATSRPHPEPERRWAICWSGRNDGWRNAVPTG